MDEIKEFVCGVLGLPIVFVGYALYLVFWG